MRKLWPERRDDGTVLVASRYSVTNPGMVALVEERLADWLQRCGDLSRDLAEPPYIIQRAPGSIDIVFHGTPGSRMWRDWLVSLTGDLQDAAIPGLVRQAFHDLVGGESRSA